MFLKLLDQCSDIAFKWAVNMEDEIQISREKAEQNDNNDTISQAIELKQRTSLLCALIAYEMVPKVDDKRMEKK